MHQNRRQYERANVPCAVTLWRHPMPWEVVMALTANISGGGLCVFLNSKFVQETSIDVQIDLKQETVRCKGTVIRCEESDEKFFKVAVCFDAIGHNERCQIQEYVNTILERQQKD